MAEAGLEGMEGSKEHSKEQAALPRECPGEPTLPTAAYPQSSQAGRSSPPAIPIPRKSSSAFPASPAPSPGTPTQISARGAPLPGNGDSPQSSHAPAMLD